MTRKAEMNVADGADEMMEDEDESNTDGSFTDMIDTDQVDSDDEIINTEKHEESENVETVWRMIGYRSCMKKVDVLSSFKFFY